MKISICIPSYNKQQVLPYCVKSVYAQNMVDAEVIIIDDCSTDDSAQVIMSLKKEFPSLITHANKKNLGLVRNWNECIRRSTGDFILILHADDFLLPGLLEEYLEILKNNNNCKFIHANAFDVSLPFYKKKLRLTSQKECLTKGNEAVSKILLNNNIACSTVFVARECYERLGCFDERYWVSPDWEMWARIAREYDLFHTSRTGCVVIHNQKNTHVSGIPIDIFKNQQEAYYSIIKGYLSSANFDVESLCIQQLRQTIKVLAMMYMANGNYALFHKYLESVDAHITEVIHALLIGSKRYIVQTGKRLLNSEMTVDDVFQSFNL